MVVESNENLSRMLFGALATIGGNLSLVNNTRLVLGPGSMPSAVSIAGPVSRLDGLGLIDVGILAVLNVTCPPPFTPRALVSNTCADRVNIGCPGYLAKTANGQCASPYPCPTLSFGPSVPQGCTCLQGSRGAIVPIESLPFFNLSCAGTPLWLGMGSCV